MIKEEFLNLTIPEQIKYINEIITTGGSLSGVCKSLGISKSISAKFKGHGYILIDKQYTLQQAEGQTIPPQDAREVQKVKIDTITPPKKINATTPHIDSKNTNTVGRPRTRDKSQLVKLTIEMNKDIVKALKFMAIDKGMYVTEYIEELLQANIPEKYYKI